MKFPGFIGAAYKLDSVNVDAQRCVNLYPELILPGKGKEDNQYYLKSTPGLLDLLGTITGSNGPVRLLHYDGTEGNLFAAIGKNIVRFSYANGVWSYLLMAAELQTSLGPMSASSTKRFSGTVTIYETVFVDGVNNYMYQKSSNSATHIFSLFSGLSYEPVLGATHVTWIDGYRIYNVKNTGDFYVSNLNSPTVAALSFAVSEGNPDNIVALISSGRYLIVFNERSTEIFSNTGNADFPFDRVGGGFIEVGCAAAFSVAKIDRVVFWLGRDENGQGQVYAAEGFTPQRISTHAIEQAISGYADISTATTFVYQKNGHSFYQLNFAEATWVYDLKTSLWHERSSNSSGVMKRHKADCCVFYPKLGIHIVGDYETNKIYKLDDSTYTDNLTEITRMRILPHLSSELKRLFYEYFQLDMEAGVGLDGASTTQGTDPQVMLQFSDDGGHTWSNEQWASAGKIGEKKKRPIWRRLGASRDRVFKISITDPVKVTLIGAELGVKVGDK